MEGPSFRSKRSCRILVDRTVNGASFCCATLTPLVLTRGMCTYMSMADQSSSCFSGMIGEDPLSTPNNLMPFVSQVAIGMRPCVNVFGDDYPTKDGTGVRDYIHVVDLALGHLAAMRKLDDWPEMFESDGCLVYNLGTGKGYSVFDMIKCMSKASGRDIKYKVTARRPGDVANVYADPSKAANELGWVAKRSLQQMCEDLWRWQSQNPKGFRE